MSYPGLKGHALSIADPAYLLCLAVAAYFHCATAALYHPLDFLLRPVATVRKIRRQAFGVFWNDLTAPPDVPPDEASLELSASLLPKLMRRARGEVLELGPGSGSNVRWFADNDAIRRIYGAEPLLSLHPQLRKEITRWSLEGRYEILPVETDVESVSRALCISPEECEVFDTILCIRVLCSLPDPSATVRELQRMLKSGGQLLVAEHVVNPAFAIDDRTRNTGSVVARVMQTFYHAVGWSFFVGGCRLTQDTVGIINNVGGWRESKVERWFNWACLPYVRGIWVKANAQ